MQTSHNRLNSLSVKSQRALIPFANSNNPPAIAHPLTVLGHLALRERKLDEALSAFRRALDLHSAIDDRYEGSFEQLSQLPLEPALPLAPALENILQYVQHRRDATRALADELRAKPDGKADAASTPELPDALSAPAAPPQPPASILPPRTRGTE